MKRVGVILGAMVVRGGMAWGALTAGWTGVNPARQELPPQKVLYRADMAQAKLDCRAGATGSLRVISKNGTNVLEIVKSNDCGLLVVTLPPFNVAKDTKLRASAYCACADGDPEEGEGYLRLYGKKEDLTYFKGLDGRGPGGPRMQKMVNAPAGGAIRKLAHRLADAKTGTAITAAIIVSGPASTSVWYDLVVEDKTASDKAWAAYRKSLDAQDVTFTSITDAELDRALANDCAHTAEIRSVAGYSRLLIDGVETAPVIFKGKYQKNGRITYAGGLHSRSGVTLQCMSVRFGRDDKNPQGIWTKESFDAKAGAAIVRQTMRLAPEAQFILQLSLNAYPEWVDAHPDDAWMLADGRKVYGQHVHAAYDQKREKPKGLWYWPSYHSQAWRAEVKEHIGELIDELKRQGLAKRIVGVHLAGYHDAQFATRHPDFSPSAIAAFRTWQQQTYGQVRWQEAPRFGTAKFLNPEKDAHQVAYLKFIKQGPFHMQEDIARHVKKCFGKPIIVGRYCMGWGAAAFNNALDVAPFLKSDAMDFLVMPPNYAYRIPGVAISSRLPMASFHAHGKLFVNEFDLRTYGGVAGSESELRVLGLSQATDFPMWETIHRKLAGQMMAERMGWWYLDMSGTWFSPPEIVRDIALVQAQVQAAEKLEAAENIWHPSVAVVVDEDGLLLCNSIAHYYQPDEKLVQDQMRALASSGVPMETLEIGDVLNNAQIVQRYKVILFAGLYHLDAARKALLERLTKSGVRCIRLSAEKPFTPSDLATCARAAGAYVPTVQGLQVNMNGSFLSVHALKTGRYDFTLPRACAVYNMKNGRCEATGTVLHLDLQVGETCWFALKPPTKRPEVSWSIMHPTAIDTNYMARVTAKAVEYGGVDSFEVCGDCHRGYSGINGLSFLEKYPHAAARVDRAAVEKNRREMNAICALAHQVGKPLYYWHREIFIPEGLLTDLPQLLDADGEFDLLGQAYQDYLRYKLNETFTYCPGLDGIVLTLTEADYSVIHNSNPKRYPPQEVVAKIVGLFAEEHEKRGKRFILRSFGSNSQDYIDIIGGAKRVAAKHGFEIETKVTEADFVPFLPKNPFLKKNPPLTLGAECDALGEYLSAGYLPAAQVARIYDYVASAREEGVDRYTIRIDRVGNTIFDSAHEVNLYAYMRFIAEPTATVDGVLTDYATAHFGAAAPDMIPLLKGELEMVRTIHYVASNLVFHAFPLKADFKTVKAGGIFSVYRENSTLAATKDIWSILSWMNTPTHAQILDEKVKGVALAEKYLAQIESLEGRLSKAEYARQHRAFAAAVKAAKALQAFAKCCVAYFEDMAAKCDDPLRLRRESASAVTLIESLMTNPREDFTGRGAAFTVVGDNLDRVYFAGLRYYCRELLREYAAERTIRRTLEAQPDIIDFVTVGGIYDDNRTIRTMHGAYARLESGRAVRQAGNPVFPNGTISVRFREVPGARVEVLLDPSGARDYTKTETVAAGWRTVTIGKKGVDYPVLRAIALRQK